jgi:hypothetical protein
MQIPGQRLCNLSRGRAWQASTPPRATPAGGLGGLPPAVHAGGVLSARRPAAQLLRTPLLAILLVSVASAVAYDIESHRWQDRLLVLVAPSPNLADVREARAAIAARGPAVRERRLRLLEVYADSARLDGRELPSGTTADLRDTLRVAPDSRRLLLIGLDGGVKRAVGLDTPLSELLAEIDAMPMRRQEIRERQAAGLPVTTP